MYFTGRHGERLELTLVAEERITPKMAVIGPARGLERMGAASSAMATAARAHFDAASPERVGNPLPALPLLRDSTSGRLRTVYKEIVVRFTPKTSQAARKRLLKSCGLVVQRVNPYVVDQVVVKSDKVGLDLLDPANTLAEQDEVVFAVPNFVTEYHRTAVIKINTAQWHLDNKATFTGQLRGEDVKARDAWKLSRGKPSVVVAVIDDGVDIDHPNLKSRIWRNPNKTDPD